MNGGTAMKTLETERLILRQWTEDDLDAFFDYAKNPNVGPSAGWQPHQDKTKSLEIIRSFIRQDDDWAIVDKKTGTVIGSFGLKTDSKRGLVESRMIGYALAEAYWGKGLMPEAVRRVLKYAFEELKLSLVSVYHFPFNTRSRRVIEKAGFKYEGTLRMARTLYSGRIVDEVCHSMTADEYFSK